jgi:hypothetical protein
MIPITISKRQYFIPTTTKDLTVAKYLISKSKKATESIELLTGINSTIITKLDDNSIDFILNSISWIYSDEQEIQCRHMPYQKDVEDIAWGKFEAARQVILSNDPLSPVKVYEIYTGYDCSNRKLYDYFHPITTLLEKIHNFAKRHELPTVDYEDDEIEAGVEAINGFGVFNTIDMLANGDILKYDKITEQSAGVVMTKLKHSYMMNKYKQKLHDIKQADAEAMRKSKKK